MLQIKVHQSLGPGLLEKVYETCFCRDLEKRNLEFKKQLEVPIVYDSIVFNEGLSLDVIVEGTILCAKSLTKGRAKLKLYLAHTQFGMFNG